MIYENVKKLTSEKGISISALEKKAGLGNGVISSWKTCSPTISNLKAVADVLGVTVDVLIREDGAAAV